MSSADHATTQPGRRGPDGILVPFLVFSGALLVALCVYINTLMPAEARTGQANWISAHESLAYYIDAERMIRPLLPTPPTRWAQRRHCGEIGHGVWFADGVVGQTTAAGTETAVYWKALFVPATNQPLFLVAGDRTQGDFQAAVHQAGLHPPPAPSSPGTP